MFTPERALREAGYSPVAGIDEAGRGPLAGPVVAAAVIFEGEPPLDGLDDSKKLTPIAREALAVRIRACARAFAVAEAAVWEIDRHNILQATRLAMRRAVEALDVRPGVLLIDGDRGIRSAIPQRTIVGGDARAACIAAASILAKVARDAIMVALDAEHPGYGFAQHKGYASPAHLARLRALGPCALHRRSFLPVRDALFAAPPDDPDPRSDAAPPEGAKTHDETDDETRHAARRK